VVTDDKISTEWARIPHFYYNYYLYQYATSFSASVALSDRILREGQPAVEDYLHFLQSGCSADPITLLRGAGVDMATAEPINRALTQFGALVDELEDMLK
jgi:oligoendopeptidase F